MAKKRFDKLSPEDREWLIQMMFNTDVTMLDRRDRISVKFKITERTVWAWRKKLKAELFKADNPYETAAAERTSTPNKTYVITWAQNATPIHGAFWENVLKFADHIDAEIHVIPGRYRNPSLMVTQGKLQSQEWWDDELTDYLNSNREEITPGVILVGDVKTQPTAVNPLRGFESLVGHKSAIFGHPKIQLQSMPRLPSVPAPIHATSLACTVRNYSDTKAGKKGESRHAIGFTIVEKDGANHHIRQVEANPDGSFTDVFHHVRDGQVLENTVCKAFVMGDIHLRQVERGIVDSCFNYLRQVAPGYLMLHDIFDGQSVNHHEAKNPFQASRRLEAGNHLIQEEINEVIEFVEECEAFNPVLVFSNHCEWLDRHLVDIDWKKDIPNAGTYLELAARKLKIGHDRGILHDIIDEKLEGTSVVTLGPNDSFRVGGWELGTHGHMGVNGARGGMTSFRKFNTPIIFGHFHSVARYGKTVQVGTFTKADMGYNKGPSSWAHAGAVVHDDGSVQQLIFKPDGNGGWTFSGLAKR